MIQFIIILLGIVYPSENTISIAHDKTSITTSLVILPIYEDGGPVGGETEQTPPPRK